MSWAKLDDQFFAHPKIINLSKDAKLLQLAAITYCAGQLTDGLVTPGAVRMICAQVDVEAASIQELLAAGVWDVDGKNYRVHDYLDYNPSGEQVRAERAATARRVAEWRANHPKRNGVTNTVRNGVSTPAPSPYPSIGENVPTERDASAPPADASEPEKPNKNGKHPIWPVRQKSETTDRAYFERVLKDAPANQRIPLLVSLAHDKIGVDDTPGGVGYARLGMLAKKHGAALVAVWILQAASEHIAAEPLDYLTKIANGETKRASQNGHTRTAANSGPTYTRTFEDALPKE